MEETVFNLRVTVFSRFLTVFLCSSVQIAREYVNIGHTLSFVKYAVKRQLHL